jgi:hypothetical protein
MNHNWRTIQIFLEKNLDKYGAPRISEVSIHADGAANIRCTCETFDRLTYCPHSLKVTKRIEKNNGSFGLLVPEDIPDELAFTAFTSSETSREFVIKYGKIEIG